MFGLLANHRSHLVHKCLNPEVDGFNFKLPCLDFRQVENVVDDGQKVTTGILNFFEAIDLRIAQLRLHQKVSQAQDSIHGCSNFMTHIGQEVGLGLCRGLRGLLGFPECPLRMLAFRDILQGATRNRHVAIGVLDGRKDFNNVAHITILRE